MTSNDLHLELSKIALARPADETPFATLDSATLEGDAIDTGKRDIGLRELAVRGGGMKLTRDAEGNIDPLASFGAGERTDKPAKDTGAAWHFRLGAFKLSGFRLALADHGFEPAVGYDLADVSATLKNLSDDLHAPVPFEAALKVAQGGSLDATGSFMPDGSGADARLKLSGLNLVPLQPVLARYATLSAQVGQRLRVRDAEVPGEEIGPDAARRRRARRRRARDRRSAGRGALPVLEIALGDGDPFRAGAGSVEREGSPPGTARSQDHGIQGPQRQSRHDVQEAGSPRPRPPRPQAIPFRCRSNGCGWKTARWTSPI